MLIRLIFFVFLPIFPEKLLDFNSVWKLKCVVSRAASDQLLQLTSCK